MSASTRSLAALISVCVLTAAFQWASAQEPSHAARGEGIWKAVVPPSRMNSEFDGFDPIGIAAGARIKADCSLNWINPDDGARYCFSSGTSLEVFLENPHENIASARAAWLRLNAPP